MDAFAGQSGSRQDLFAEWRKRDEGVDFCLIRSKPAMNDVHARNRRRPRQGRTKTSMPQARPWKMADAILARLVFAKKERICARQPVVVQRLHGRHSRLVRRPENTRAQEGKRIVYVHDTRGKTRNRFFHHGVAAKRPHRSKSRGKEPHGAGAVQFLRPGIQLLNFVTVASQELGLKGDDSLFPAPARTVFVVDLKNAHAFRRTYSLGRPTGKRPRPSSSDFREVCIKKCW